MSAPRKPVTKTTLVIGIGAVLVAVLSLISAITKQSALPLLTAAVWLVFGVNNICRYAKRQI